MGNEYFLDRYTNACAEFQPYRNSYHSPAVLKVPMVVNHKAKTFKFANFITSKENFGLVVSNGWASPVEGYLMFQETQKLKRLKPALRKLMWSNGNLHDRVIFLRKELDRVQMALDKNHSNVVIREEESVYLQAFNSAILDEEKFLNQKAKVEWLREGDRNTK